MAIRHPGTRLSPTACGCNGWRTTEYNKEKTSEIGSFEFELTPLSAMLAFVPLCVILELAHADPVWIFITSGLAIIPLAGLMGTATEHLAEHLGAGVGGLLNATFGKRRN